MGRREGEGRRDLGEAKDKLDDLGDKIGEIKDKLAKDTLGHDDEDDEELENVNHPAKPRVGRPA